MGPCLTAGGAELNRTFIDFVICEGEVELFAHEGLVRLSCGVEESLKKKSRSKSSTVFATELYVAADLKKPRYSFHVFLFCL